ncbi:MAG: alpha-L-fucosidase [Planctomycetes bacterium]|nr:alpha-L-fucosidase [Planctomycetota bacterium]
MARLALALVLAQLAMNSMVLPVRAETPQQHATRMAWWREARFGMFVHWGVYAVPAGEYDGREVKGPSEWLMNNAPVPVGEYVKYASRFNPAKYDPAAWVAAAKAAGMKYIVITSKHHDGFCLWDSKVTDYDVVDATPYGKDLLAPLAAECRKQGLHFGVYYSIMDWHHPSQEPGGKNGQYSPTKMKDGKKPEYVAYMKAQLKELTDELSPEVFWFDGEWPDWWTEADGRDLYDYLLSLNPNVIVNNRVGKGRKGMEGLSKSDQQYAGDFGTPEQRIPPQGLPGVDWESCMTMNNSWGYKKTDHQFKSAPDLIRNLIDIASKGGNYLLNVGPTAEGEIPAESLDRLAAIGQWMTINGDAIHGSTASPFPAIPAWGRVTTGDHKLYLCVFDWPKDHQLVVPRLHNQVPGQYLISNPTGKIKLQPNIDSWTILLPDAAPDATASVVVMEIEGNTAPVTDEPFVVEQGTDGSITLAAHNATTHGKLVRYEPQPYKNTVGYWANPDDWYDWQFTVTKPGSFQVVIQQGCGKGNGGSDVSVTVDDQAIQFTVQDTGGFQNFIDRGIGIVTLDKPGPHTLAIHCLKKARSAVMDCRQVLLIPTK